MRLQDSCTQSDEGKGRGAWRGLLFALFLIVTLAGCGVGGGTDTGNSAANTRPVTASPGTCLVTSCAAQGVSVFVEPEARATPIVEAIKTAKRSVWVEVYVLTESGIVHALEEAAARGVDVRVMLEAHPYGDGTNTPQRTLDRLNAAGVHARATNPTFHYTHAKMVILDGASAFILTANLSRAGLGGTPTTPGNREYLVLDANVEDVAELSAIFLADWEHRVPALRVPRVVVSPVNARGSLVGMIAGARRTLEVEDEEFIDPQAEEALLAAARRGVIVRVALPTPGAFAASQGGDVERLRAGGVEVRFVNVPYMHAKLVIVDGALAFAGSENFSATSLDENREVGLMIADTHALDTFTRTFALDWTLGTAA